MTRFFRPTAIGTIIATASQALANFSSVSCIETLVGARSYRCVEPCAVESNSLFELLLIRAGLGADSRRSLRRRKVFVFVVAAFVLRQLCQLGRCIVRRARYRLQRIAQLLQVSGRLL